jgi:alpha-mannosidase
MSAPSTLRNLLLAGLLASTLASGDGATQAPRLRRVIVAYKTHFDIGYTDLVRNVLTRYRTSMIDGALDLVDQSRAVPPAQRFAWTVPGWPMSQILWEGQTPERRRRVEAAYRDGRIVTHALPFTTHTESLEIEDLVRGMGFSSRLARAAGLALPRDAKMTDVPSHSWIIPTMLKHAGVDFFHIGCNSSVASPDLPRLFWWEGPDGSRVLTMYSDDYGSKLAPPEDWPYDTWLALIHSGDNHGPPSPESIRALMEEARQKLPGVEVRMGRLSDFSDSILASKPQIPVVRGDMPDTWIHGLMSMPIETNQAHRTRPLLAAVEALNTLLTAANVAPSAAPQLAAAYEQSLLYGEHTWGFNVQKFGPRVYGEAWEKEHSTGKFARMEESFADHGAYSNRLRELTAAAAANNLRALAENVSVEGPRVVVYNGLPWRRGGLVEVEIPGTAPAALKDAVTGETVRAEKARGGLRFVASDVPAMGYRTYVYAQAAPAAPVGLGIQKEAGAIENRRFKVTIDARGGRIASILDKRTGRELVDRIDGLGFGGYLRERFSRNEIDNYLNAYLKRRFLWAVKDCGKPDLPPAFEIPYGAAQASNMSIEYAVSAVGVSATLRAAATASIPHASRLTITLPSEGDFIDLTWGIENKRPTPWPEAGWLALPLKVRSPRFRLGRLGAVVEPGKDTLPGSNHEIYCLNSGMAVVDEKGQGVALCPIDSPLVSLDRPGIYKYSRNFLPERPLVLVNLYNNHYSTNFQQWIQGSWSSRVRVWAVDNYDDTNSLLAPSEEARVPLVAGQATGGAGRLPATEAGIELSRRGVKITAFGKNPDGVGLLLRLWEQAGSARPCAVRLPKTMRAESVEPCDLRGRAMGPPVKVVDGGFDLAMQPFAPVSVLIR